MRVNGRLPERLIRVQQCWPPIYKVTIDYKDVTRIKYKIKIYSARCNGLVQYNPYNRSDNKIFNLLLNSFSEDTFLSDNGKLFHKLAALNLESRLPNVVLQLLMYKSFLFLMLYWCT